MCFSKHQGVFMKKYIYILLASILMSNSSFADPFGYLLTFKSKITSAIESGELNKAFIDEMDTMISNDINGLPLTNKIDFYKSLLEEAKQARQELINNNSKNKSSIQFVTGFFGIIIIAGIAIGAGLSEGAAQKTGLIALVASIGLAGGGLALESAHYDDLQDKILAQINILLPALQAKLSSLVNQKDVQ